MFPPAYTPALKSPVFNEADPYFGGARPFEVIGDRSIPNFYFYDWQRTEKIIGDEIDTMLKARKTPRRPGTTPRPGWSRSSGAEGRAADGRGQASPPRGLAGR